MNTASHDGELESELKAILSRGGEPGEVGDLLEIANRLHAEYALPQPSAAGMARGRERLLAAIVQAPGPAKVAAVAEPRWRSRLKQWIVASNPFARLMLSGGLAVVFLFMCNTVLTISAESLPGDPLYNVKRAQEQVIFNLTLNGAQRLQLQEQFDEVRVKEVEALQKQMRVMRTEVSGIVESITGRTVLVGGLALDVPMSIDISALRVGDRVVIAVETEHDGKVSVVNLHISEPAALPTKAPSETPRPSPTPSASGTPQATATIVPTLAPRATEAEPPDNSPAPTQAPRATATERPEPTRTPRPPTVTPKPTDSHEATETPRPQTVTPQPTGTWEPTDTPRPPSATPQPTDTREATRTPDPTSLPNPTKTPEATKSH